jgi:hypothetical protein
MNKEGTKELKKKDKFNSVRPSHSIFCSPKGELIGLGG